MTWMLVALGNRDCGDDGAGPAVADALAGHPGVRVVEVDGDAGALIDALASGCRTIVVDAVRSGAPVGTIHRFGRDDALPPDPAVSTHDLGLSTALGLARALGRLPADLTIYGIEGGDFGVGRPLSAEVAAAARRVAGELGVSEVA